MNPKISPTGQAMNPINHTDMNHFRHHEFTYIMIEEVKRIDYLINKKQDVEESYYCTI